MGACVSVGRPPLLLMTDGDHESFKARFMEDRVLGKGEFGVVKLVHEVNSKQQYACKTLYKGTVFKDNTLYPPMSPGILRGEVEMLQQLAGQHYCLKLQWVYETPRTILMVTECCLGGEMLEYLSRLKEDLRTEDVSRISFQLLDAVHHCARQSVLHRDIKPENIMFISDEPDASLRLIDFGCGTMIHHGERHTTFSGTPFYNSPEMFQKKYTQKTDVWSVGVTLYVLVAGYPSGVLQKAFNLLLSPKRGSIKQLPHLPDNMPEPYYDMLDQLLVYNPDKRKTAGEVLSNPFVRFHDDVKNIDSNNNELEGEQEQKDMATILPSEFKTREPMSKVDSIALKGSVHRHALFLDFMKFERILTAILATMLNTDELHYLIQELNETNKEDVEMDPKLKAVTVRKLKDILLNVVSSSEVIDMVVRMQDAPLYENHSYDYSVLQEFIPRDKPPRASIWGGNLSFSKHARHRIDDSRRSDTDQGTDVSRHSAPGVGSWFTSGRSPHQTTRDISRSAHGPRNKYF